MAKNVNEDYPAKKMVASAEELKARALANYEGETAKTHDFPTEVIDLPSRGLLYAEDSTLRSGQVELKYMTAKEEDILTTQSYIKQGVVLDKLFQSLIISNGKGERVKYSELLLGDKNAIMIAARVLGYGPEYDINVNIPGTEESFSHTVDLTEIGNELLDESLYNNSNEFEYTLPIGGQVLKFKLLTGNEEVMIAAQLEKQSLRGHSKGVTTRLQHQITSIDGNVDKAHIDSFINNQLIARDSLKLRNYILNMSPDIDLTVHVKNDEFNFNGRVMLPIGLDFFWPRA